MERFLLTCLIVAIIGGIGGFLLTKKGHGHWVTLGVMGCAALFGLALLLASTQDEGFTSICTFLLSVMGPVALAVGGTVGSLA